MNLLSCEQGKTICKIKAHLMTKYTNCTSTGTVALLNAFC